MPTSFAEVYDQHVWTVHGFLRYRLRSPELVEDLTQLTFERAFRAWGRYDPAKASVSTWLLAIARNLLIDHVRADRSGREAVLDDEGSGVPDPRPGPSLGPDPALADALAALTAREREILGLRFGADLTGPEIAELTGLSLANVQQITSRSLRRLRALLAPEDAIAAPVPSSGGERAAAGDAEQGDREQEQPG